MIRAEADLSPTADRFILGHMAASGAEPPLPGASGEVAFPPFCVIPRRYQGSDFIH
jgi:hypothetical protein